MSSGFGSIGGGGNTVVKRPHHQTHIFWDYESINPEQTPAAFVGTVLLTPVLLFRRIKEFLKEKQVAQGSVHGHVWVPSSSETVVGQLRDLQLQTTLLDNKLLIHRAMSAALASVMNTMPTNDTSIVVVTKDKAFVEQIKTLSDDGFSVFLVHDAQRGTALVDILETHATQAFHLSDIFASRDSSGGAQQQQQPPPLVVQNVAAAATPSSAATYHHLQQHHHHHIPPYHAPPPPLAAGSSPVVAPSAPLVVNNGSSGVTIVIEGRRVPLEEVVRSEAVMSAVRSPNTAPVLRWCTSKQPHSPLECRFAHLAVSSNPNAAAVPGGAAAPPSAVSPALPPSYNQTVQSLGKSPAMTAPPPPAGVSPIMSFFSPPPPPPPAGSAAAPPPPSSARFGLPAAVVPSPATRPNNMNSNVSGLQGRKSSAPAGVVHREDNSIGGPTRPFMNQSTDAMPPPAATTVSVWQDGTPSSNLEGGAALKSILHKLSTDSNPPFADDDDDGESLLSELRGVVLDALGERPTATLHQSGYGAAVEKGTAAPPKSVATGAAVAAVAPASSVPASGNEASSKPQKQSSLAAAVAALPSSHAEDDTPSGVDTRQKFPWGRLSQAQQPADHNNTVEDRDELPTLDSLKSEPSSTKKQTSKSSSSSMVGGGGGGSVTAPANSNKASFASIAKAHATAAATPSSPLSSANNKVAVAAPPAAKQKTVAGGIPTEYLIDGRHIPAQQLVRNRFVELYAATAGGIPHARFCTNTHAHNMMECTFAHRDVYPLLKGGEVEGSTLLNNKALENLRSNTSFKGNFCTSQKPHEAKTCTYLHKK